MVLARFIILLTVRIEKEYFWQALEKLMLYNLGKDAKSFGSYFEDFFDLWVLFWLFVFLCLHFFPVHFYL